MPDNTFTGKQFGYVEKPTYINGELVRAVDVVVDELIGKPIKLKIETIAKSKFDDLNQRYLDAVTTGSNYYDNWQETLGIIENLKLEIEQYKQIVDSEKILTAVANNETQAANDRYASLLIDFQNAITKGIQEAIARVSLEAQVRGLQAQKEVMKQQLEMLNNLVIQLTAQVDAAQIRQASSEVLDGIQGTYDQLSNTGWKIPQFEVVENNKQLYIETYNDDKVKILQGSAINLYNFNENSPAVFTLKVTGDAIKWLEVPSTITIPPRVDTVAGRGFAQFKWKPKRDDTNGKRKRTFTGAVVITSSFGEVHTIKAEYWREVDRKDTWDPRGIVRAIVGREYTIK
jgi:hypothetical protein